MPIVAGLTNSFKTELLRGEHNLSPTNQNYKIALIKPHSTGIYNSDYDTYIMGAHGDEVTGEGYKFGGKYLVFRETQEMDGVAFADFEDVEWTDATFEASGAIIYHAPTNKTVAIFDFGKTHEVENGTFEINTPEATSHLAVIRIS